MCKVDACSIVGELYSFGQFFTILIEEPKPKDVPARNVFKEMMAAANQLKVPSQKKEGDQKSKLFNTIAKSISKQNAGWTIGALRCGESYIDLLCKVFWTVCIYF